MDLALPLDKMSVEEKLRALELLWEDLARTPSSVPSPAWHKDVLEARERRLREGKEKSIPWDEARQSLRSPNP
jgi:putative addiction module component (TIGR02574 family)